MKIDPTWSYAVGALLLGFLFKVLYDELKSPKLKILAVSKDPFQIEPEIKVIAENFDRSYNAYRIKIANKQKRYLHCAAENCMAWIELESASETYQLCWAGNTAEVTINVGDVREVDICARGAKTGQIVAPTGSGYFNPSPRAIGDGTCELRGKLRISSRNGRKAEERITIMPTNNNRLEVRLRSGESKKNIECLKAFWNKILSRR